MVKIERRALCPSPRLLGSVHSKRFTFDGAGSAHSKRFAGGILASLLAEAAEKRDVVAEHGIVGAGVLHGCVELAFYAGDGLQKELA